MRRSWTLGAALCCALWLPGCVSQPVRAPIAALPAADLARAMASQSTRESRLAADVSWMLEGRAAITRGDKGGSGRIDWRQDGDAYHLALSAPVTRQSWRLVGDAAGARIEGLDGGPREGPDAARLLLEATGLEVPVAALAYWARGARADETRFGVARLEFDAQHRLARLQQGDWAIDYLGWQASADGSTALPTRLNAERGDARVRLVVDRWSGPASP